MVGCCEKDGGDMQTGEVRSRFVRSSVQRSIQYDGENFFPDVPGAC